jgi:hypothetical protein
MSLPSDGEPVRYLAHSPGRRAPGKPHAFPRIRSRRGRRVPAPAKSREWPLLALTFRRAYREPEETALIPSQRARLAMAGLFFDGSAAMTSCVSARSGCTKAKGLREPCIVEQTAVVLPHHERLRWRTEPAGRAVYLRERPPLPLTTETWPGRSVSPAFAPAIFVSRSRPVSTTAREYHYFVTENPAR